MKKKLLDVNGDPFEMRFRKYDISKHNYLLHVTPKENKKKIKKIGLKTNQPLCKHILETGLLFLSYPIKMTTEDFFRCYDDWCVVFLDAKKLHQSGYKFYKDPFSNTHSSLKNHLVCDQDIPANFIVSIKEF